MCIRDRKKVLSRKDHENITIGRIKSQYGSKRGERPLRFQQHGRAGSGEVRVNHLRTPSGTAIPPRTSSTTPYPIHDGPPVLPPTTLQDRPATSMPYPTEAGPPRRTSPNSHGIAISPRPFPPERPSTAAPTVPGSRPISNLSLIHISEPTRPY